MIRRYFSLLLAWVLLISLPLGVTAYDGAELVANGSFSSLNQAGNGFSSWSANGGWGNRIFAADGCVKIQTNVSGNHWIMQSVNANYLDDALYRISADIDMTGVTGSAAIRLEFYSSTPYTSDSIIDTAGTDPLVLGAGFQNVTYTFTPPAGTRSIALYVRIMGYGTAYFDNVSMKRISEPSMMTLGTDWVFYYTDWETGRAEAVVNVEDYPDLSLGSVTFSLTYGESVVETKTLYPDSSGKAEYGFLLSKLAVLGGKYIITAVLKDSSGNILDSKSRNVYRYDRPTYLRADGVFEKNNTVIDPVIMTGIPSPGMYPDAKNLGSKIVTVYSDATTARLNSLQDQGLMALVLLYRNMLPAGHRDNIDNTREKVTELMNHPALFGYAIMDEPFYNFDDPREMLEDSYKAIRDIDPNHPVYMVEIKSTKYSEAAKYCDILCADIYPGVSALPLKYTTDTIKKAADAVNNRKALYILMQAFRYFNYIPSGGEMRNMIYRALFEGADGIGYYRFSEADGALNLDETATGAGIKSFFEKEQGIAFDIFIKKKLQMADSLEGADVVWRTYLNDGNLYAVALNQKTSSASHADIPCQAGTKVKIINGTDTVSVADNAISFDIPAGGAVLLELFPVKAANEIHFCKDNVVIDELRNDSCDVYYGGTSEKFALLALRRDDSREIARLSNPDFEDLGEDGLPTGWSYYNSVLGTNIQLGTNKLKGQYSLKTVGNSTQNVIACSTVKNIRPGQTFDISVSANNVGLGSSVSFKIEFYRGRTSEGELLYENRVSFSRISDWQTKTCSVTVPDGSEIMYIYLCNYSKEGTVVYFDNITVTRTNVSTGEKILDLKLYKGSDNPACISYPTENLEPGYYILTAYLWGQNFAPLAESRKITIIMEDY